MRRNCPAVGIIFLFVGLVYLPVIGASDVDASFKMKEYEFGIKTVDAAVPLPLPNELLCIVHGGIGHFEADIYAPMDWTHVYWIITLEDIRGKIPTKHSASGFIEHVSYG
jgi:hypothetical protein